MKQIKLGFLLIGCMLFLSACATGADEGAVIWGNALDTLKQKANYTVLENGYSSRYTPEAALVETDGEIRYFSREDSICYVYVHNEDPDMWIRSQLVGSDLYFYAYEQIERLNKISGFLDQGLLTYDPEKQAFLGDNMGQTYVFRGKTHTPVHLEVRLEDGVIAHFTEVYWASEENEKPVLQTDTVTFTDFSTTEVRLPLNTWDESELTEFTANADEDLDDEMER